MNRLKIFIQALAKPVGVCLPLFVWSLVLQNPLMISFIRYAPLKAILMFINIGDWATADLYFVILLALLFSYVCFAISYKLPKCGVCFKVFVYALLIFTFVARKFLMQEFGMQLTPYTFSLLQETNGREVSGFFGDYILSSIGLKYLVMMLLMSVVVGFSEWFYGKKLQTKILTKSTILGVLVSIAIIIGVPAILGGV